MATPDTTTAHITSAGPTLRTDSSNKYKGVRKRKWGKWVSEIRLPNSRDRIWLGSYDSPEKAARAFDAALYCLRGSRANFNFPHTPFQINVSPDQSLTPHQIQELAARFANEHQDPPLEESPEPESNRVIGTAYTSSSSICDGAEQVDHGDIRGIDWSFLNSLGSNEVASDSDNYGLYSGLDKMHSGELYPTSPPPLLDNIGDGNESDDAFSQQSLLLWNF